MLLHNFEFYIISICLGWRLPVRLQFITTLFIVSDASILVSEASQIQLPPDSHIVLFALYIILFNDFHYNLQHNIKNTGCLVQFETKLHKTT